MSDKTAKVTAIAYVKEWQGKDALLHIHRVTLDNGDEGEVMTKDKEPAHLQPGQELNYTIETTQFGEKIKVVKQQSGGGGWRGGGGAPRDYPAMEKAKYPSFALAYSNQLAIANINAGVKMTSEQVMQVADKYLEWLNKHTN